MAWRGRTWATSADEQRQGRKRGGRTQETEPDRDWMPGYEVRTWDTQPSEPSHPPTQRPREDLAGPSSSCSVATSVSQILAHADVVLEEAESEETIRKKLDQIRTAVRKIDPRDHVWTTIKKEELRLTKSLSMRQHASYDPAEQAVMLQREYHEANQMVMLSWEKRQKAASDARVTQDRLGNAESEYVARTVARERVGAKLQSVFRDVAHQQTKWRRDMATQALRDMAPPATFGQPRAMPIQATTGTVRGAESYPRSERIAKPGAPAPQPPPNTSAILATPKCPVLAQAKAETAWQGIQQAARSMENLVPPTHDRAILDISHTDLILQEVDEAVRMAQRAKELLRCAVARATVNQRAGQECTSPEPPMPRDNPWSVAATDAQAHTGERPPSADAADVGEGSPPPDIIVVSDDVAQTVENPPDEDLDPATAQPEADFGD